MYRPHKYNRDDIVAAASELFHRAGYVATSLQDIADECGVPKGHFYFYFRTKEALLRAVLERRELALRKEIDAMRRGMKDPLERLGQFTELVFDHSEMYHLYGCPHGTLAQELAKARPDLLPDAVAPLEVLLMWFTAEYTRAGEGENAGPRAWDLLARIEGHLLLSTLFDLEEVSVPPP